MSDMNTYTWGVKGLPVLIQAVNAAEDMGSTQLIVNTSMVRDLIDRAQDLWQLKNKAPEPPPSPRPFVAHLRDLEESRRISELQGQIAGLRRDNLLAASELRENHVARLKMQQRLDVLEIKDRLWTQTTDWGGPETKWAVAFSGLIIPSTSEADARRLASKNEAIVLMQDTSALREAPEVEE